MVGASTGYMVGARGDWPNLVAEALLESRTAVELSTLSFPELPTLVGFLASRRDSLPFDYVSVHAPTKLLPGDDSMVANHLAALPGQIETVVMHPDVLRDPSVFEVLGERATIENMDARKPAGQTVRDLERFFDLLPTAGFCLDVPHAASIDPTMVLANELLDAFGPRLRQVHLSSLNAESKHVGLTEADAERFEPVLERCSSVPWILEAPSRLPV
jgi:hypothetical protein